MYEDCLKSSGANESWRLKVVVVGAVGAGKTSLVRGWLKGVPRLCQNDDRTKGVDVHVSTPVKVSPAHQLEMVFWDFAGHINYLSTHQLFLSKGALHLLVIDIKRFSEGPFESRGDLIFVWLDALLSQVPGCNLVLVATKADTLDRDHSVVLEEIKGAVESHLRAKIKENQRMIGTNFTESMKTATLYFHGVEAVSGAEGSSLLGLRERLARLVMVQRERFPNVGSQIPVSVARASAALRAKVAGGDPCAMAWAVKPKGHLSSSHEGPKLHYIRWKQASKMWNEVVVRLDLQEETGVADDVLKAAVDLQVERGMFLQAAGLIYVDPVWINKLLWAILDHDLVNPAKEEFWVNELQAFVSEKHACAQFLHLKKIHDTFCSTGTLTVGYLRFLWREVVDIGTDPSDDLFWRLLDTMSQYGVIFKSPNVQAGSVNNDRGLEDNTKLFVPVRLLPMIVQDDLRQCKTQLRYQYREELIFDIYQSYVPQSVLGLLIANFLRHDNVLLHRCWSRGASFTMGGPVILLHLSTASEENNYKATITANTFGQKQSRELFEVVSTVQKTIESLFAEHFSGLFVELRDGRGHCVEGADAVLESIKTLSSHIDFHVSLLLKKMNALEGNLDKVAESSRSILARLTKLQSNEYPYPSLVSVRNAAAAPSGKKNRTLRSRFVTMGRRAKGSFTKEMRLCFLCPFDLSEVPCGLDGNGYDFNQTRDWVKTLRPALQVTAVIASVAVKAGTGYSLPVSDLLNVMKEGLGEDLADRTLERIVEVLTTDGDGANVQPADGKPLVDLVGQAYEELKTFMVEHKCRDEKRCVHFKTLMKLVDDGKGGQIWVSKVNAQRWKDMVCK